MDSLITAAARALAAGDPLGALKRVATDVLVRDSHVDKRNLLQRSE
jgi:D-aminopeptidase